MSSLHEFPEQWRYPELGAALRGLVIQGEPSSGCCHIIVPSSSNGGANGGAKHCHQTHQERSQVAAATSSCPPPQTGVQTGVRNIVINRFIGGLRGLSLVQSLTKRGCETRYSTRNISTHHSFSSLLHRLAIHSHAHFILIITVHVCHFMLSLYGGALSHLGGDFLYFGKSPSILLYFCDSSLQKLLFLRPSSQGVF